MVKHCKIIGISGSPRDKNTNYMLRTVLNASGSDYELILLKDKDIKPCNACGGCWKSHKCIVKDDMQELYDKLLKANIIVLGSPTYFDNVTSLMKIFIDRCSPLYISEGLKDKKVALVSVGAFEGGEQGAKDSVKKCINNMKNFCELMNLKIIGNVIAINDNPEPKKNELIKLGKKLVSWCVNRAKKSPKPGFLVKLSNNKYGIHMKKDAKLKIVMTAKDVVDTIQLLESENIDVWLDGGWGVDALLEKQTRAHKDVDVIVCINDVQKMQRILKRLGFRLTSGEASTNFVLKDKKGREVNVHPVRYDEKGNGIYRMENGQDWVYPVEGFTGKGKVGGREVYCLTARTQMLCHTGYKPNQKDFDEMKALHQRFGIEYPEQYKNRFK